MPLDPQAPGWARELALGYESGAHGQFILHGNVADRFVLGGRRVGLIHYLDSLLLGGFELVFVYDPGNGLTLLRGAERMAQWQAGKDMGPLPRDPRAAIELVTRYLRYRANLSALGHPADGPVAVIVRASEQVLPGNRSGDFEIASLASLVRDWAAEPPFTELAFASFLITDNLSDLHPLVAGNPRVARVRPRLWARAGARCWMLRARFRLLAVCAARMAVWSLPPRWP